MSHEYQEMKNYSNNVLGVLTGILIGGIAGAAAMFLLAPQSGEKSRKQIQNKGIELRDQTTGMFTNAFAKVRLGSKKLSKDGRNKAKQLLHDGQELVVEQLDHVSDAAKAGKKAVRNF